MSGAPGRGLARRCLVALLALGWVSRGVTARESAKRPPGFVRWLCVWCERVFAVRRLRVAALLLLAVSPLPPWFSVPEAFAPDPGDAPYRMVSASVVAPAKAALAVALAGALALAWRRRRLGSVRACAPVAVTAAVLAGALLAAFPAAVVQRGGSVSAQAAFLQAQHDNVTWLGGDLWTAREYALESGKPALGVKEPPRAFYALPSPPARWSDFRPARHAELIMWLGYTPAFCQFVGLGWFCAVIGASLTALAYSDLERERPRGAPAPGAAVAFAGALLLGAVVSWGPAFAAGRALAAGRDAMTAGDESGALRALDRAEAAVPILAWHTDLVLQRGRLARHAGAEASPEARLAAGAERETQGLAQRAAADYVELVRHTSGPVRAEALRGLLRLACVEFNSGRTDLAADALNTLLRHEPTALKGWYALQLAELRLGRAARLERAVARMEALYSRFRSPEKTAVLSMAHHHLAELAMERGDLAEAEARLRRVLKP